MGQVTFSCGHTVAYMRDEKPKRCPQCKYQKAVDEKADKELKKKGKFGKIEEITKTAETDEEKTFKDSDKEVKKSERPARKW